MEQFGGDIMGGFCPREDFVQGDFVRGILSRGFCPGGFCPRTVIAAFLDVEKVFDNVWHNGLRYKILPALTAHQAL